MSSPKAGSSAISVPKAAVVRRRSASISSEKGMTGSSNARPKAVTTTCHVMFPIACGTPMKAAVTAATGMVIDRPCSPANRSPMCWVSTM